MYNPDDKKNRKTVSGTLSSKNCHMGRNTVSNYILKENKKNVKQYETIEPVKNKMYRDIATKEANSKRRRIR